MDVETAMTNVMRVRVWDVPTRLFHWMLVALLLLSWWTAEKRMMDWHRLSGIVVLSLVVFRLVWGVIGGSTARFSSFLRGPAALLAYARGGSEYAERPGHNPLGGYSVVVLLLLLAVQVVTGLFATDIDGLESGPLSYLVSFDQGRLAATVHETSFNLLLALSALHVLAIAFYLVIRRRNLVRAMVTGSDSHFVRAHDALVGVSRLRFVVAAAIAAAVAWYLWNGLSFAPTDLGN
jgi:cytochrome b